MWEPNTHVCIVNTKFWLIAVLTVKLREAMEAHHRRTGARMTYERLSTLTGLSRATLASLASRENYDTRISTIAKLCHALGCAPGDLLALTPEPLERAKHEN